MPSGLISTSSGFTGSCSTASASFGNGATAIPSKPLMKFSWGSGLGLGAEEASAPLLAGRTVTAVVSIGSVVPIVLVLLLVVRLIVLGLRLGRGRPEVLIIGRPPHEKFSRLACAHLHCETARQHRAHWVAVGS